MPYIQGTQMGPSMKEYEQSFCIIFYFENMYEILEMFSLFYNLIFFFNLFD